MFMGNVYLSRTNEFLHSVTETSGKVKHTIGVYTLKSSKVKKVNKIKGKKVGTLKSIDTTGTNKSLKDLKKKIFRLNK